MAGGRSDLIDVGGSETALAARQALRGRLLLAEEVGLQRLHPGGVEQHRGVIRRGNQRRRGPAQVFALLEVRQVGLADLVRSHAGVSLGAVAAGSGAPSAEWIVP